MFDKPIEWLLEMFRMIVAFFKKIVIFIALLPRRLMTGAKNYFTLGPKFKKDGITPRNFRLVRWIGRMSFFAVFGAYMFPLFWHASYIRNYDIDYPKYAVKDSLLREANETTNINQGNNGAKTCGRSQLVDMQEFLINFLVNDNYWMPQMPQYKLGIFGYGWKDTPFLDNKVSFQEGAIQSVRRVAMELSDLVGRDRGTSEADEDLQNARGALMFDTETWWFNPFDKNRPFGPTTPAASYYRNAINLYESYNSRLEKCKAVYATRQDVLRDLVNRIANDLGSFADRIDKQSRGVRYDPETETIVYNADGNNRGWFDFHADNTFMEAKGMMYAYHGLIHAISVDFADVIKERGLSNVWNRMEGNFAVTANYNPRIIANGAPDGFIIPDHLTVMSEGILRARTNLNELENMLDR